MTLQSSGAISFGDINDELGFSRTSQLSIGGGSARSLAGVSSGAIREAADFYGKSRYLDVQTVTVGFYADKSGVYGYGFDNIGYYTGSISDGTSNPLGGAAIRKLFYDYSTLYFVVDGTLLNDGWTNMTIGSSTYKRELAYFTQYYGLTYWYWYPTANNDFGTTVGATVTVYFT